MKKIVFLFLLISQISSAQTEAVTEVMEEIVWEQDSILSVYNWVAENMSQSVSRSKRKTDDEKPKKRKGKKSSKKSKKKSAADIENQKLKRIINRKKGSSHDVATVFDALVSELGYESYIVKGFSKNVDADPSEIEHSWNAVKVNGAWKLYDASWGGGAIVKRKFVKNYNAAWYDVEPTQMIKGHIPFDPAWQLLDSPVNYDAFDMSNKVSYKEGDYDYNGKLDAFFGLGKKEQMQAEYDRSLAMNGASETVTAYQEMLYEKIENFDYEVNKKLLAQTQESYSEVGEQLDLYKKAKKNKFKDKKWSRKNSLKVLNELHGQLDSALSIYDGMEINDDKLIKEVNKSIDECDNYLDKVNEELEYMESLGSLKMDLGKRN